MKNFLKSLTFLVLWLVWQDVFSVMEIEITEGVEGAHPIAIAAFSGDTYIEPGAVESIVRSNLWRSGLFNVLEPQHFPQVVTDPSRLHFQLWREAGVESLLIGRITRAAEDQYRIEFRLYDLVRQKRLSGHVISSVSSKDVRKVGHKISDMVFESLTGIRGSFSTHIVYVRAVRNSPDTKYELRVADFDGHNARTVFSSATQLMSPTWAPDGTRLAYVSFEGGNSAIYVQDVVKGTRFRVSAQAGMNSAPAWSPDGRYLALTLSIEGSSDIYLMDTQTRRLRRITSGLASDSAIDTEACWMPDSKALLFTSDRSDGTQVYRVSVRDRKVERITFQGKYNAAPDVSPDGRYVAMVHNGGNGFRIAVMDLKSGAMRVLTDGNMDEGPSYAPNGKMIIYATLKHGREVLAAVSSNGRARQQLQTAGGNVRAPDWSSFHD